MSKSSRLKPVTKSIGDVTQKIDVHLPPPPKTEPNLFTVPYRRNKFFTGRDAILTQIHDTLGQIGTAALSQTQAIHGLGGVGKTQTAVEYAHRYYQKPSGYDWVLWVNASSLTLAGSFGAIATDLALPNHRENKLDENIAAVKRWLATHDRWLLIFDSVDDPDAVQPFLPNAPHGRILELLRNSVQSAFSKAASLFGETVGFHSIAFSSE